MPLPGALLLLRLAAAALQTRRVPHAALTDHVAVPSAAQLAWMDLEIGANICYGIGMPNAPWSPPTCSCYGNLTAPPAATFNSTPDFAQWVSAFTAMGAKYSVIPASGGCGYALWPSEARFPDGGVYNYSVAQSPLLKTRDVMRSYVEAMRAHGIGTGVYFQLFYDYWGGFLHGKMSPNGLGAPKLSAAEFFDVAIQQLEEVWGPKYGDHTELWFDGGLVGWSPNATARVSALMASLQPHAVAFQGPSTTLGQAVRWIGNENGHAAAPNWISSQDSMANGPGHPNGSVVAPAEVDTPFATGQSIWWWAPDQTFKSLRELQIEYDNSVGHNANLLLGVTPDFSGSLPAAHVARYTEFGDWHRSCYGSANMLAEHRNVTLLPGLSLELQLPPNSVFDRLWLMEDLRFGQKVGAFTVEIQSSDGAWSTPRPWLFPCSTVGVCGGGGGGPQGGGDSPWAPTMRSVPVFNGTSVGHKRIIKLASNETNEEPAPVRDAAALRVNFSAVMEPPAMLRSFAVFGSPKCA